jgi:hypothetical protein
MSNDKQVIEQMLQKLGGTINDLRNIQNDITSNGLSLDIDRIYDSLEEAREQLQRCQGVA